MILELLDKEEGRLWIEGTTRAIEIVLWPDDERASVYVYGLDTVSAVSWERMEDGHYVALDRDPPVPECDLDRLIDETFSG